MQVLLKRYVKYVFLGSFLILFSYCTLFANHRKKITTVPHKENVLEILVSYVTLICFSFSTNKISRAYNATSLREDAWSLLIFSSHVLILRLSLRKLHQYLFNNSYSFPLVFSQNFSSFINFRLLLQNFPKIS